VPFCQTAILSICAFGYLLVNLQCCQNVKFKKCQVTKRQLDKVASSKASSQASCQICKLIKWQFNKKALLTKQKVDEMTLKKTDYLHNGKFAK
jgi:hypothetical protein